MKTVVNFWKNLSDCTSEKDCHNIRSIDAVRFEIWIKENNLDPEQTYANAENLNKMEEWYLNLASAWGEVRAEISQTVVEEDKEDHNWAMGLRYSLKVIDKYLRQEEEDGNK